MAQLERVERARDVWNDELRKLSEILTTGTTSTLGIWHEFIRLWELKTGETYSRHARGKDLGVLGRLLKQSTPARVHAKFLLYFRATERWVVNSGYSLAVFEKMFNGLGVRRQADPTTEKARAMRQERAKRKLAFEEYN